MRTWQDEQDADGGITSRLGFRVVIENDGQLRVIDAEDREARTPGPTRRSEAQTPPGRATDPRP